MGWLSEAWTQIWPIVSIHEKEVPKLSLQNTERAGGSGSQEYQNGVLIWDHLAPLITGYTRSLLYPQVRRVDQRATQIALWKSSEIFFSIWASLKPSSFFRSLGKWIRTIYLNVTLTQLQIFQRPSYHHASFIVEGRPGPFSPWKSYLTCAKSGRGLQTKICKPNQARSLFL